MAFPIFYPIEKRFYYAYPLETLQTDTKLLAKVKEEIKEASHDEETKRDFTVSYGIFPTEYDKPYKYVMTRTGTVQPEKR